MKNLTENPKVSVIITNYNGQELLAKNLPSVVAAQNNFENNIGEIIVVDDASTDTSWDFIKTNFPGVRLIRHTKNRGFSASTNTGARSARYSLLAFLNSDVEVTTDFLKNLLPLFKDNQVFGVSLHETGYGYARAKFTDGFVRHWGGEEATEVKNTFWLSGGSCVIRRDYWMLLGGLDEKLFSPFYWEDVDLSYRAQKRGFRLLWDPYSRIIHNHESTVKKISQHYRNLIQERNELIFIWKNITSPNFKRKHITALIKRIGRHPGYLIVFLMAFSKLPQVIKARKKEKKESKISDEAIFSSS